MLVALHLLGAALSSGSDDPGAARRGTRPLRPGDAHGEMQEPQFDSRAIPKPSPDSRRVQEHRQAGTSSQTPGSHFPTSSHRYRTEREPDEPGSDSASSGGCISSRRMSLLGTECRSERNGSPCGKEVHMSDVLIDRPELSGLGQHEFGWSDSDAAGASARRGVSDEVVTDILGAQERARLDAEEPAQGRSRCSG